MRVISKKNIVKKEINRILIRTTNWVGDMVISLPALEAVRANFPWAEISLLAKPWVIPLLENHPAVNNIIPYKKGPGLLSDLKELFHIALLLRKKRFDMAILFQNAFEAALLPWLGRVRFRVGYNSDCRGFLLTHNIIRDKSIQNVHQVEYYLSILRSMGWEAPSRYPVLRISSKEMESVHSLLQSYGIDRDDLIVGLSPGAVFGQAKRWPSDRFAAIGDWSAERWKAKVIIMGSKGEKEICKSLSQGMKKSALNLCGKTTLKEAAALINRCQYFITNDSGLMHIAAALNVPMVAIFGSTDPIATGPLSRRARIVKSDADCAPCLKPQCSRDFRCMLKIEPRDVWDAMEALKEAK